MYINILLDIILATDVNKYSLASVRCQPIWRTLVGKLELFLAVAKDCGIVFLLNQSQPKHQSVFWLVSQSRRMSAICVAVCRWISLTLCCCHPLLFAFSVEYLSIKYLNHRIIKSCGTLCLIDDANVSNLILIIMALCDNLEHLHLTW